MPSRLAHPTVVADVGGLLVVSGLLEGSAYDVGEILVLDAASLVVGLYLALRHEGSPQAARDEFALASGVVSEWFPVRAVALDAAFDTVGEDEDVEAYASLALAEALGVPLVTKHGALRSDRVPILRC